MLRQASQGDQVVHVSGSHDPADLPVVFVFLHAKFLHVPEYGDGPAPVTHQDLEGSLHRLGIGVVAVIDDPAAALPEHLKPAGSDLQVRKGLDGLIKDDAIIDYEDLPDPAESAAAASNSLREAAALLDEVAAELRAGKED